MTAPTPGSPEPPRRSSGAPEIPEVLRAPTTKNAETKRRWSIVPKNASVEMRAMGVGLDFAAMVGAGALIGWGAASWFENRVWLYVWIGLGFASAGWKLYKDARILNRDLTRQETRRRHGDQA